MSSGNNYSDATENPSAKRRRISLACSACRTRKSRCDGHRPKCSGCDELGFECIYVNSASTSNVIIGKEYLTNVEERLKAVEQDIRLLKANQYKGQRLARFEEEVENDSFDERGKSRSRTRKLESEEVEVNKDDLQDSFGDESAADGMGAMVFSAEEDCGFFGPSSNIAFTRHVSRAMARTNGSKTSAANQFSPGMPFDSAVISISQPPSPTATGSTAARQASKIPNRNNINIYALPPETTTRSLIARYFGDTGLLFPYIDEQAVWDTYNEVKANGFTKVRRTWLGLLNIIMAMATSTTVENGLSAEKRAQDSDIYYHRATGLCEEQIMRGTSLEIVQYLLLTGQYLQGTQRSVEAWTAHGLAVKGAFQLGLHSTAAASRFRIQDLEFRKRTWYGCVVLDRTLSMTFGRPAAIPDDYIRIPLPQHLQHEMNNPNDPNDRNREFSVDFFNATITLYKIMWNVMNQLYGGNIVCGAPTAVLDTVSQLFGMEHQLSEWERLLPPSLDLRNVNTFIHHPDLAESIPSPLDRFRVILKLRYYNLRILLHRPILVMFLDMLGKGPDHPTHQEATLLQQIGSNSIQICVQSSRDIVAIIRANVMEVDNRSRLGAWWFSLYYTFNAALVIFGSFLVLRDRSNNGAVPLPLTVSELELQQSLNDAAASLRRLDQENRMVDRCAAYLEQLASVAEALAGSAPGNLAIPHNYAGAATEMSSGLPSFYPNGHFYGTNMMNTSPLGMDLGEFLLEGDLEFLNQIANTQHSHMANAMNGAIPRGAGGGQVQVQQHEGNIQ